MKKLQSIILVIALLMGASVSGFGQKFKHASEVDVEYFPRHEVFVQYGTPTILELVTMLKAPSNFDGYDTRNQVFTGTPGVGYNFSLRDNFSLGVFAGYSYAKADICKMDGDAVGKRIYSQGVNNYVGQLSANWMYYQDGALTLESGLYLGVAYMDRDITKAEGLAPEVNNMLPKSNEQLKFAYHFSVCKLRYGNTFGVFGELGFGFRGLLNLGLSVKL